MGLNLIHNELLTKIFEESIVIIFLVFLLHERIYNVS